MARLPIDPLAVTRLLSERLGLGTEPVVPATRGMENHVFLVGNEYVLRCNRPEHSSVYRKEVLCYEAWRRHGVPAPKVFDIGIDSEISYLLIGRGKGIDAESRISELLNSGLREEAFALRSAIWQQVGGYCRMINSIPTRGFGLDLEAGASGALHFALSEWSSYIDGRVAPLLGDRAIFQDQDAHVFDVFLDGLEALRSIAIETPSLCHGNISLPNTIVHDGEVTMLIDAGESTSGDPLIDLAEMAVWYDREADIAPFLSGYGATLAEYEADENVRTFMLGRTLWGIRYGIREQDAGMLRFCRRRAKELTTRFGGR